ncbi:hypothetical protein HK101_011446, partial [Irineochytrium annulatum]
MPASALTAPDHAPAPIIPSVVVGTAPEVTSMLDPPPHPLPTSDPASCGAGVGAVAAGANPQSKNHKKKKKKKKASSAAAELNGKQRLIRDSVEVRKEWDRKVFAVQESLFDGQAEHTELEKA